METLAKISWFQLIYALMLVLLGFIIAKQVSKLVNRALVKRFSRHQVLLIQRLIFYILFFIFVFSALQQLGFKMTVLLGAAGVFTVALSFASQTAASNLVSGIFLLFERPFKVGDLIKIKDLMGVVDSIDLLSTKIKTSENMRIRIPNETIMKSDIINMSFFDTQRIDILIGVAYSSDIDHVKAVLMQLVNEQEAVKKEPAAQVIINKFGDAAIELKFMVWTQTSQTSAVKNQLQEAIKRRFDQEKIEIPFSQMTLQRP
ncbi:mechanosensitive ion channel family protein [Legionella oakridgensis]|uniref:Small-conductance mechanosensitive channel n=2 Tax=Legionella oakridgensis TaxID=29423 RepID=W0BD13_9GAMM|nr:mechanosensitive ion channel family protein [Legionella oakridgensis]AHE66527.1 small-conductance mechanosensitive channel [Legionella oakridgensis ATCC 33761 = DSM 21215]KTD37858.1 mechanosensitive ion channel MscS [Legionella oakridgensis]STY19689.1 mechanosensitive ion channel MscS [Legionella longbeachae]